MRKDIARRVSKYRVVAGPLASRDSDAANGAFEIPCGAEGRLVILHVIASDGSDWADVGLPGPAWEHVSVSLPARCPTWNEMCFVKRMFWGPGEAVIQLHPEAKQYVNNHPHCLHLWRPIGVDLPVPPATTVGLLPPA